MKVAILCAGLDSVRRGYETHQRLLFESLRVEAASNIKVVLFKRDGARKADEIVLSSPSRRSPIVTFLKKYRGDLLYWESLFFGLWFTIHCCLKRRRFDRILVIEPMLCKTLFRFKKLLPGNPKIIFTHSVWNKPHAYVAYADKIQEVNVENYNQSILHNPKNIPIQLIPHFDIARPVRISESKKSDIRNKYHIKTPLVLLSVGILEKEHKRMDYVIKEASHLSDEWSLVICGSPVEMDLIELGKELLGERFIHLSLPRDELDKMYQVADLFVLGSTYEGFGIVILEAMKNSLPVILHRRELFQWILKDEDVCLDLTKERALSNFIRHTATCKGWRETKGKQNYEIFEDNYTWETLRRTYVDFILS